MALTAEEIKMAEKIIDAWFWQIDETRAYDDCIALREEFFSAEPQNMGEDERMAHLNRVILHSFDLTISDLLEKGRVVSCDTVKARNSIIFELKNN